MLLLVKYQVCTRTNVHIYVFKDGPTNNTHDNDDNDDDDSNKSYNIIDILFKKAAMHFKCKHLVKDFFFPFSNDLTYQGLLTGPRDNLNNYLKWCHLSRGWRLHIR